MEPDVYALQANIGIQNLKGAVLVKLSNVPVVLFAGVAVVSVLQANIGINI